MCILSFGAKKKIGVSKPPMNEKADSMQVEENRLTAGGVDEWGSLHEVSTLAGHDKKKMSLHKQGTSNRVSVT